MSALGPMRGVVLAGIAVAAGSYYLWTARLADNEFSWNKDLDGYYNYLAGAFTHGHLDLPIVPAHELLDQPNPWDPTVDQSLRLHDAVLFHGRYYLYHGAGPAVMLFVPWRLVSGHDLPENFGAFLFCFGGFLFSCGALLRILKLADAMPGPALLAVLLIALGTCQGMPYLLNRALVYGVAISAAYLCLSAAVFFLARSIQSRHSASWLAASGLLFGLTISCRPHLGLAGAIALAGLCLTPPRKMRNLVAFSLPLSLVGLAVAWYNYARFGNPFEFGVRYMLTEAFPKLALRHVLPGLYYLLFCAPDFSAVFPWVTAALRHPFNSPGYRLPQGYFLEPTVGSLYLAPLLAGVLLIYSAGRMVRREIRALLWILLASSTSVLLFITATGITSLRYELDYLPHAVLAVVGSIGILASRSTGWRRAALGAALAVCVAFGAVVNLALGITGPNDDLLKNRPEAYMRMARWFSPVERYRPLLNPTITVDFAAEFTAQGNGSQYPLLRIGHRTYGYSLFEEHSAEKLRFISQGDNSVSVHEMERPRGNDPVQMNVRYSGETGTVTIWLNGQEVLAHPIKTLLTAAAQITVGENRVDPGIAAVRFSGRIAKASTTMRPAAAAALRAEDNAGR